MKNYEYKLAGQWNLAAVNKLGFIVLTAGSLLLFGLTYFLGAAIRETLRLSWQLNIYIVPPPFPILMAILAAVIILHEVTHGLAFLVFGRKPYFGFKLVRKFFPVFFTSSKGPPISRDHYLIVDLAPFLALTALFLITGVLTSDYRVASMFLMAMALNVAASTGDLWIAWKVRQHEAATLFEDKVDGFRWYHPSKLDL